MGERPIIGHYYIPSQMSKEVCDLIVRDFYDERLLKPSLLHSKNNKLNSEIRKSNQRWLDKDTWVASMLTHFIKSANIEYYRFNLTDWKDQIQFTVYEPPDGHYRWHIDMLDSTGFNEIRKLSIVMCLTSKNDYGGGELELFHPTNKTTSFKLDAGDVVIFPSIVSHRVKKTTWGRRISLVGWYGGPPFA